MDIDAVVIGGGIAGLSAAYELKQQGVTSVVLERSQRAGGVILSEEIDGYTVDAGPDALLVQKPDGIRLCEELGLGPALVPTKPPRVAYILRGGRLHALPAQSVLGIPTRVKPFIRTALFSWRGKMRMAAELLVPRRDDDGDESIGAFMTRRFGAEATDYLAEPLLAGIHAGDVNRLSVGSLFPRFVDAERKYGSLLRGFRQQATGRPAAGSAFRSLTGGLSQMVRALTGRLEAGTVRLGVPVRRVTACENPRAFSIQGDDSVTWRARAVIFATPAFVTSELMGRIDPDLANLCGEITYSSTATVVTAYRRSDVAHPLNGSGFVVPRVEGTRILAGSWMSSKWPNRAPADRVLLRAFVGGTRDPAALERSDVELVRQSAAALEGLLGIRSDPLFSRVYRWERSTAQHEVGHGARLAAIEQRLARQPGVFVTGSGFRGVGIPDCIADGRNTARLAASYLESSKMARPSPV